MPALLRSIDACALLIVNDNAPEPSPHADALAQSAFARQGRLVLDRTPFTGFATARNRCLTLHREHDAGAWAAFVDADEVHGEPFARVAGNLHSLEKSTAFVDGYTWHFFQSCKWYRSIERRMAFFRVHDALRWSGAVHERLDGVSGSRLALPYVYAHYGWVLPIARQAAKERLYAQLGAPGKILPPAELDAPQLERSFAGEWRTLMRFSGEHPAAARPIVAALFDELRDQFAAVDRAVAAAQARLQRAANALMRLNYEQRWRARALDPRARRLLRTTP